MESTDRIQEFFISLIDKKYIRDEKSITMLNQALESFPEAQEIREKIDYEFMHNLDTPILSEMMKSVNPASDYEAILLAPFFAPDESVIKRMKEYINIKKIMIALPRGMHNLVDPSPYIIYFDINNIDYTFYQASFVGDGSRLFHSKFIYLKNKVYYILVGSPNITRSALLESGENGNIECAILLSGEEAGNFIENIKFLKFDELGEIRNSGINDKIIDLSATNLKIYSAEFNDAERSLRLILEPICEEISVNVIIEGEKEPLIENRYLKGDELKIEIPRGIPKEVIITSKEKSARFRVYYDRNYFFRNLPKNKDSLKQINARLSYDFSQDLSEFYAMIISLARRNQSQKETIDSTQIKINNGKENEDNPPIKPSKIRNAGNILSHIHRLNKLYQSLCYTVRQRRDYENLNPDENEEEAYEQTDFSEYSGILRDKIEVELDKQINLVNNILIEYAYLLEEENQKDNIVQSQSTFIDFILRPYHMALKEQHFEHIEQILEYNLNMINRSEISKDSAITLFMRLIAMNYCYDLRIQPRFMSNIFLYSDLIEPETYYSIKEFVMMYQKNYCPDKSPFMPKKFQFHFSSLMTFVFSPSNIGQGSTELIKTMIETKDQEFLEFIGMILIRLKYGAWNQRKGGGRISLFTPRRKIKEMNHDFSILDPNRFRYINEFLNESIQRERIIDLLNSKSIL